MGVTLKRKSVFGSVTQTVEMNCETSAAVDDLVRQDTTTDEKVIVAVNNSVKEPILGIISKKLTTTRCEVILRGVIDYAGISRGKVRLSSSGDFTIGSIPDGTYLQTLGYSFGNGKIHFEPNAIVTKKS